MRLDHEDRFELQQGELPDDQYPSSGTYERTVEDVGHAQRRAFGRPGTEAGVLGAVTKMMEALDDYEEPDAAEATRVRYGAPTTTVEQFAAR